MKTLHRMGLLALLGLLAAGRAEPPAENWPSFRGPHARGVADGQNLPASWNAKENKNIKWKTRIPGLAHSSPIIWGDLIFVTTAVSSAGDDNFKPGLYGAGTASADQSVHQWKLYALDKHTGKIVWERVAYEGAPKEKRHIKSTYASSMPATNGKYVVALFGSQGLHAFDMQGKKLWEKDLGRLNVGAYNDSSYEWGAASSPIIFENKVIVQVDTQNEDFILAADLHTGKTLWKTTRDEKPS